MPPNSKQIQILIIDDEKKACANLRNILLEFVDPGLQIVGEANSTIEAEQLIALHQPDAVFLDIEMPNENAFHFLERITPFNFEVIFITAYEEYAIRAFRLNAIDYILKPISIKDLSAAVQKLKDRIRYKRIIDSKNTSYTELAEQVQNKLKYQKIILKDLNAVESVDFNDIYFIEAQGSYSRFIFCKNGKNREMTMSNPLSEYEEMLPGEYFFRVHRSYLINCKQIRKVINEGHSIVVMKDGTEISVSRRRYAPLIDFLQSHNYI